MLQQWGDIFAAEIASRVAYGLISSTDDKTQKSPSNIKNDDRRFYDNHDHAKLKKIVGFLHFFHKNFKIFILWSKNFIIPNHLDKISPPLCCPLCQQVQCVCAKQKNSTQFSLRSINSFKYIISKIHLIGRNMNSRIRRNMIAKKQTKREICCWQDTCCCLNQKMLEHWHIPWKEAWYEKYCCLCQYNGYDFFWRSPKHHTGNTIGSLSSFPMSASDWIVKVTKADATAIAPAPEAVLVKFTVTEIMIASPPLTNTKARILPQQSLS